MRPSPTPVVLPLLLLVSTAACADVERRPSDTAADRAPAAEAALEPVTAHGIAAVVRDVVGAERIAAYSTGGEGDSVGVMVRLEEEQVLGVNVATDGAVPVHSCDDLSWLANGDAECTTADDGTILASGTGEALSDRNKRGSTVLAQSVNPKTGRVVYALYETFAAEPGLEPETLAAIVADPDLAAMTSPATNDAGADIVMEPRPW